VSFDTGGELARKFADAWFEQSDALLKRDVFRQEND